MARYFLKVIRADNRLIIKINGSKVYEKHAAGDPVNEVVEITDLLNPHPFANQIHALGYNAATHGTHLNPWWFHYQILADDRVRAEEEKSHGHVGAIDAPKLVFERTNVIVKER